MASGRPFPAARRYLARPLRSKNKREDMEVGEVGVPAPEAICQICVKGHSFGKRVYILHQHLKEW